jgi:hypothetical protein
VEAATAKQPQQGLTPTEEAALAGLVVAILSGLTASQLASYAVSVLGPLGLAPEAIRRAVRLLFPHLEPVDVAAAGALGWVEQTTPARQAAYIRNAATRLSESTDFSDVTAERRYLHQHIDAERGRRDAARRVDLMAARHGPTLGWYSVRDEFTTHGCALAHGLNFRAERPPLVEGRPSLPGTVHVHCRCRPGAPHAGAELLP